MSDKVELSVYTTEDICILYGIHKNRIEALMSDGTIPPCLTRKPNAKRLWSKNLVDNHLHKENLNDLAEMVIDKLMIKIDKDMDKLRETLIEELRRTIKDKT